MWRLFTILALLACCNRGPQDPAEDVRMTTTSTEAQAIELAKQFVEREWNGAGNDVPYTLEFESIRFHEGAYQVRFTKIFQEPTKENPPYRLVVVNPDGTVEWAMP